MVALMPMPTGASTSNRDRLLDVWFSTIPGQQEFGCCTDFSALCKLYFVEKEAIYPWIRAACQNNSEFVLQVVRFWSYLLTGPYVFS